jgi:hypothetical protein
MARFNEMNRRLLTVLAVLALAQPARADFYLHHWEDFFHDDPGLALAVALSYYQTTTDYDATGNLLLPANLQSYNRVQTDVSAAYSLSKSFDIFARLSWARIAVTPVSQTATGTVYGSAFGPTDQSVGASWRVVTWGDKDRPIPAAIDLQVQVDLPAYSNSTSQTNNTPFVGDGSLDVTAGAFARIPIMQTRSRHVNLIAGAGFTYRTAGFSEAIPWTFGGEYAPNTDGLVVSAFALGSQSLQTDVHTTTGVSSATGLSSGTDGSFITNAINPTLITARGTVGYKVSPDLEIDAFFAQTVFGQASPYGFQAGANLQFRIGAPRELQASKLSAKEYGRSNQGFVGYSLDAHVIKASDRLNLVKIDKGSQDGVAVGQIFDIFLVKADGSVGEAVARAKVTSVKGDEAALSISEYFKEVWIEEGFVAKRPVQ